MLDKKNQLRQNAKLFRDGLVIDPDWSDQAAERFFENISIKPDDIVAVYYPMGSEINPFPIVSGVWIRDATVCLPIINEHSKRLNFARWSFDDKLIKSTFGIFVPEKQELVTPNIIITPMLAFDQSGHRIGYGGGYYDTTIAALRAEKDIMVVGLAYAQQAVLLALPREDHDQKLDFVITQQRLFDFRP